jgi:hypothetical protein
LPLELFADVTEGVAFETNLVVKAKFRDRESCFIIHVEHQGEFRQDYVEQRNPVASAFMAKMKIKRRERPQVKLACLQSLVRLRLNPAQLTILSGFIDTYLRLEPSEEQILRTELDKIEESEKESVMEIVTSWMEQGIERGLERGRGREITFALKILRGTLGSVSSDLEARVSALSFEQLDTLGDALVGFDSETDLRIWLEGLDDG